MAGPSSPSPDATATPSSRRGAIALLSPALGDERAQKVVAEVCEELGIDGDEWSEGTLGALFDLLSKQGGLVGITARVVTRRLRMGAGPGTTESKLVAVASPRGEAVRPHPSEPLVRGTGTKPYEAVSDLMEHALGPEAAQEVVLAAMRKLGLPSRLTYDDALKVLELVAQEPGVVGISGHFAKTRLHLLSW